jgi:hypothetical protein
MLATTYQRTTGAPAKRASKPTTTAPEKHRKTLARTAKAKHAAHSASTKHPKKRYTCSTCLVEKSSGFFAAYTPSAKCTHSIHTCNLCLKKYVNMRISEAAFVARTDPKNVTHVFGIGCPECKETMLSANVRAATTLDMFQRFEAMEHKYVASHIPGWRWCMAPSCSAGQVHEKAGGICMCRACGARVCVPCDVPFHEGETCAAYQARIDQQHAVENTKSVAEIQVITQPCPHCGVKIQKNGGCGEMQCKRYGRIHNPHPKLTDRQAHSASSPSLGMGCGPRTTTLAKTAKRKRETVRMETRMRKTTDI